MRLGNTANQTTDFSACSSMVPTALCFGICRRRPSFVGQIICGFEQSPLSCLQRLASTHQRQGKWPSSMDLMTEFTRSGGETTSDSSASSPTADPTVVGFLSVQVWHYKNRWRPRWKCQQCQNHLKSPKSFNETCSILYATVTVTLCSWQDHSLESIIYEN